MAMARRIGWVLTVWLLLSGLALAGQDFSLTILHTNDIHARLSPIDPFGAVCTEAANASGACVGGAARLATAVAAERAKGGPTLLLDAGDQFQGSLYFTVFRGEPLALIMNRLGYDAMTLGNHEFDSGPAVLAAFIKALRFPVVAADVDVSGSPELKGLVAPYVVREIGGRKIGIVGAGQQKTPEKSTPGPDVVFNKTIPAVAKVVTELRRKGVPIVIVLSHAGLEPDKKLAAAVPGIDVIVGGHSHVLLSNDAHEAEGGYPYVVSQPGGGQTLVVTAGCWGRYLGVLHVRFDQAGRIRDFNGNPVPLGASVAEDPGTLATLEPFSKPLESYRATVLATTDTPMDAAGCRKEECLPGDLLAEALLAAGSKDGAVAALVNGGSVRAGLPAGNLTLADVYTAFPFPNTLATLTLTGADLADILEHGLSRMNQPGGAGRFLQVAGLRYVFDPAKPEGSRLLDAQIADAGGWFSPLLPEATYRVAVSGFLLRGGDGYDFHEAKDVKDSGQAVTDVVVDYLKTKDHLPPALDGRIQEANAK